MIRVKVFGRGSRRSAVVACHRFGVIIEAESNEPGYPIYGTVDRRLLAALKADRDVKSVEVLDS